MNPELSIPVVTFLVGLVVTNLAALVGAFVSLKVTQAVQGEKINYLQEQNKELMSQNKKLLEKFGTEP